ncbi:beta-2-glycoprotein 1-like [Mytilus trossulus]|uniref:beta-2-glycoprotein 1-like n=1 Tax=Mytilus trossulus TaxID=6551 RepID=UPI003003E40B
MDSVYLVTLFLYIRCQTNAEEVTCYNKYNHGQNYVGNVSKTVSGKPCLNWKVVNSAYINLHEKHTYCRNPLPREAYRPWCYTGAHFEFSKCIIPVCDCRNSTSNHDYDGKINITRNGHTCIHWDRAISYRSQQENSCRTPPGDSYSVNGPWCYVDTKGKRDICNVPICDSASCPFLSYRPHLQTQDNKDSYRYGETVNLVCETGYKLNGFKNLSCQESGDWSNAIPTCEDVTCPGFSIELQQSWHPVKRLYMYNDIVTLTCDEGYDLTSSANITCQSNGIWSGIQPNCTGVLCSPLPKIDSALLPNQTKEYRYPDTFKVTCETGYEVEGADLLQCNSTGSWSSIPRCTSIGNSDNIYDDEFHLKCK